MQDDPDGALEDLDAAAGRDGADPWFFAYRAAALFRSGNLDRAARDIESFVALRPAAAAGYALRAVVAAGRGRREEAESALARALKVPRAGWIHAVAGSMRARWGDLEGARADIERAARLEPSAWVLMERAVVQRRTGRYWLALKDLRRAERLLPGDPEPCLRASGIQLDQAQYARAGESLGRALAVKPDDPGILRQRARVRFVGGDSPGAREDLERAVVAGGGDPYIRQELTLVLAALGEHGLARRELSRGRWSAGAVEFLRGFILCRSGGFVEAEREFARAEERSRSLSDGLCRKAGLYRWTARLLAGIEPLAAPAGRELTMIGLGYRQLWQLTAGALRALRTAERLYCNHSDLTVREFLALFPVPYRPIVFRGTTAQAVYSTGVVMAGFRDARRVAMVTRAQPLVYGRLAYLLARACWRRKFDCRATASVSIFDAGPATVSGSGADGRGMQIRDRLHLRRINPGIPLFVYSPKGDETIQPLGGMMKVEEAPPVIGAIARAYPEEHPCYLFAGGGDRELEAQTATVAGLPEALNRADVAVSLYLPPVPRSRRPRP